jgi:TnpA family transposase
LCALRYLGFAPDELGTAPATAIHFVAHQLGLTPEALQTYGHRLHTRTDHLRRAQAYLGFRKAAPAELNALAQWLLQRALEHDKPTLLLALACEQLHREHIVRPGIRVPADLLRTALEETDRLIRPHSDAYVDYFGNRYKLRAAVRTDLPSAPYVPLKP